MDLIVIIIAILIGRWLYKTGLRSVSNTLDPRLKSSLFRLESCWELDVLADVFKNVRHQAPEFAEEILKAYHHRKWLIIQLKMRSLGAFQEISFQMRRDLSACRTEADRELVAQKYAPVMELFPEFESLFGSKRRHRPRAAEPKVLKKQKDLFAKCLTLEEVKKRYRRLAHLNHPDKGGSEKAMKIIIEQYEEKLEALKK